MITISARLFDERTLAPIIVSRIFMQIQARNGVEVWPLEVVRKDAAGFDILIGTSEMKANTEYLIRISNNWNLSPSASFKFKTKKKLELSLIPLLPIVPFPIREPVHDIKRGSIKEFIFRTQMDMRVCPICKQYENVVFTPDVWKPIIPDNTHSRCRCTYDIIFKTQKELELTASLEDVAKIVKFVRDNEYAIDAIRVIEIIEHEELLTHKTNT